MALITLCFHKGLILNTVDGGNSWSLKDSSYTGWFEAIAFADEDHAWVAGGEGIYPDTLGIMLRTTDGGKSWTRVDFGKMISNREGWIVGKYGIILKTTDGGLSNIENMVAGITSQYNLYQNYPNPFNSATNIQFQLPQASRVEITVFNILGHEVATILNEKRQAGIHQVGFDASELPGGVYFYRLQAGNFTATRKFILMK